MRVTATPDDIRITLTPNEAHAIVVIPRGMTGDLLRQQINKALQEHLLIKDDE